MSKVNEKILDNLNEKWDSKICPMCGATNWAISPKILELREFDNGNITIGGHSFIYPVIPVSCKNCGNVILISATISGMMSDNNNVR